MSVRANYVRTIFDFVKGYSTLAYGKIKLFEVEHPELMEFGKKLISALAIMIIKQGVKRLIFDD